MALTVDDIKNLSPKYKALILIAIFIIIGALYYSLFFQAALAKRAVLRSELDNLQQQIAIKERVAQQIDKHRQELAELQKNLQLAMARLPEQKEIPGLLSSVSQAGIKLGLDFVLFEPMAPVSKDFYAEIPVKITVMGGYHDLARFFEKVAKLPRIVNIENIKINRGKGDEGLRGEKVILTANCDIKTYMFLEPKDEKRKTANK
ncbi:MAG TPA: pilus assembly protein PilO [Deltaproteobacteria bacterium]|nr:pilus assembly protein PilO [Deltaproteobacteria bacterium]